MRKQKTKKMASYYEAKKFVLENNVLTSMEYLAKYKYFNQCGKIRLPRNPNITYAEEWKGWKEFLSKEPAVLRGSSIKYATFEEAKKLIAGKVFSKLDYSKKYKNIIGEDGAVLPSSPHQMYAEWKGWGDFISIDNKKFSESGNFMGYFDAKKAIYEYVVENGIKVTNSQAFFKQFVKSEDFNKTFRGRIPRAPYNYYASKNQWVSWNDFVSKDAYGTLTYDEMKKLFAENNIHNMDALVEYTASHPEARISSDIENTCLVRGDWGGWDDLFSVKYDVQDDKPSENSELVGKSLADGTKIWKTVPKTKPERKYPYANRAEERLMEAIELLNKAMERISEVVNQLNLK